MGYAAIRADTSYNLSVCAVYCGVFALLSVFVFLSWCPKKIRSLQWICLPSMAVFLSWLCEPHSFSFTLVLHTEVRAHGHQRDSGTHTAVRMNHQPCGTRGSALAPTPRCHVPLMRTWSGTISLGVNGAQGLSLRVTSSVVYIHDGLRIFPPSACFSEE